MIDFEKLKKISKEREISLEKLAKEMKISVEIVEKKLSGTVEFTTKEMSLLCDLLEIEREERIKIFFKNV